MSKSIPLSQGLFATVDDADFEWLSAWKWSALKVKKAGKISFYAVRMQRKGECEGKPKMLLMHRVITEAEKGFVVDHRDHDGLNNQRDNLRVCTQSENMLNSAGHADRAGSKYKGVSWNHRRSKWVAEFRGRYIGIFAIERDAADAYDKASLMHNSEFAVTNRALARGGAPFQR